MNQADYPRLLAAVDNFRSKRILCIGDVMLDRYVYGDVERISPEAPIPVLSFGKEESMLGAAGNVAKNIAALGAKVEFYSVIGDDKAGLEIKSLLSKENNIISYLTTESTTATTTKTRYLSGNQQILRVDVDSETKASITIPDLENIDAVVYSDYCKGVFDYRNGDLAINGVPLVVDTKSWFGNFRGATVIAPNLGELASNVDWFRQSANDDDVRNAATEVMQKHDIKNVLVTRSSKGMTLVTEECNTHHIPSQAKEVFDVVGAGDTVAAVLSLGLAAGLSVLEAAFIANIAGGIVVEKRGTATVTPHELKCELLKLMDSSTEIAKAS